MCGSYKRVPCDRLPFLLDVCPVCSGGVKVSRGFTLINPLALFGIHEGCKEFLKRNPPIGYLSQGCPMCYPKGEAAYIMGVGEAYYPTPADFMDEGDKLGISKRIPHTWLPRELVIGETVIYLAHPKACMIKVTHSQQRMPLIPPSEAAQPRFIESEEVIPAMGIFTVFIPQRIEQLLWKSQATREVLKGLKDRGITPVLIKDGDKDHE